MSISKYPGPRKLFGAMLPQSVWIGADDARAGVSGKVGLWQAGRADRIASLQFAFDGARNQQIRQRGEYSRSVDVRCDLAVGHAEGRAAIDIHLDAQRPARDQAVHNLVRCLERLAPQQVAGHLMPVVEAETAVALLRLNGLKYSVVLMLVSPARGSRCSGSGPSTRS